MLHIQGMSSKSFSCRRERDFCFKKPTDTDESYIPTHSGHHVLAKDLAMLASIGVTVTSTFTFSEEP